MKHFNIVTLYLSISYGFTTVQNVKILINVQWGRSHKGLKKYHSFRIVTEKIIIFIVSQILNIYIYIVIQTFFVSLWFFASALCSRQTSLFCL